MGWTIDTTDANFEELDEGGLADIGLHTAILHDTYEDEKGDQVFVFKVDAGLSRGCKLYYRLYDPDQGANEEKQAGRRKQAMAIMKRLGVLTATDVGNPAFEPDWLRALNKRFVVEVAHEEFPPNSGKKNAKITMYGIFNLDSTHVKAEDRRRLGLPVLPEQLEAEKKAAEAKSSGATGGPKPRRNARSNAEPVGAGAGANGSSGGEFTPPSDF